MHSADFVQKASAEQERIAQREYQRLSDEGIARIRKAQYEAKEKDDREIEARFAELLKDEIATSVKALSKLPRGYKDVCEYVNKRLISRYYSTSATARYNEKMNCINFGVVASLGSLREAGFNVTNVIVRDPGDPRSSLYNVEKVQ